MALIVEDGSIVANANSYNTLAELRSYASARGYTLPTDDTELEAETFLAMDYLEALRSKYQGMKVSSSQSLQWPRECVYIDGFAIDNDVIPTELKNAQCQLTMDKDSGIDLQPNVDSHFVIKEKVDVIETEYSEAVGTSNYPTLEAANALLKPLLKQSAFVISTYRA